MSDVYDHEDDSVYVSEELVVEILKRLPVKSLLRFMSVCKAWYSLIRTPDFVKTHLNHQIVISNSDVRPRYLLFKATDQKSRYHVHRDDDEFSREMEFIDQHAKGTHSQVGYCHGILCFARHFTHTLVLWNLSLRKTLEISMPLDVVPQNVGSLYGFGFDAVSNDYKVVWIKFTYTTKIKSLGVWVYSLNAGTWKQVDASFVLPGIWWFHSSLNVHLDGVIYWLPHRDMSRWVSEIPDFIVSFDLADNTIGLISLPKAHVNSDREVKRLMTFPSNGRQSDHLAYYYTEQGKFHVWVRGADGDPKEPWRQIFTISDHYQLRVKVSRKREIYKLMNVRRNGEIVVEVEGGRVASLNPKDMHLKVLFNFRPGTCNYLGTYLESLVLL